MLIRNDVYIVGMIHLANLYKKVSFSIDTCHTGRHVRKGMRAFRYLRFCALHYAVLTPSFRALSGGYRNPHFPLHLLSGMTDRFLVSVFNHSPLLMSYRTACAQRHVGVPVSPVMCTALCGTNAFVQSSVVGIP